ncbi:YbjQ family protein [Adlercreutzia equolifaciens]|uniref:YbjQ family protein n=1 Tax=Adlercreutzia equolifaciens TaxID=446660 RepID=UPI003AEFAFB3
MSLEKALEKRDELDEDFGSDLADASPQERKQALEADKKREQAKQAFLDALEKDPSLMMTTAGSSFEGWRVTGYCGTISTDAVVGSGIPAAADAIAADLTDQRSLLLGSKMERAKKIAWRELLFRAHEAGANGVLAVRYDVYMLPKGLFGASVTGTAVAIEQLGELNQALSQDLFGASVTGTAVKMEKE